MLPLQVARVQSLVKELRSHRLCQGLKKEKMLLASKIEYPIKSGLNNKSLTLQEARSVVSQVDPEVQ